MGGLRERSEEVNRKAKAIKLELDKYEAWFEDNPNYDLEKWEVLYDKFLVMLDQYVGLLEEKHKEKSDEEIKKILVQAEKWFDKNPNHPKFNDMFKEYRATLRVFGKRRSLGETTQETLFDF